MLSRIKFKFFLLAAVLFLQLHPVYAMDVENERQSAMPSCGYLADVTDSENDQPAVAQVAYKRKSPLKKRQMSIEEPSFKEERRAAREQRAFRAKKVNEARRDNEIDPIFLLMLERVRAMRLLS